MEEVDRVHDCPTTDGIKSNQPVELTQDMTGATNNAKELGSDIAMDGGKNNPSNGINDKGELLNCLEIWLALPP